MRKKRERTSNSGRYMKLEYESFCELSCIYFAEELMKAGYVDRIERSPSYLLCDPVQHTYVEQLKRSSKQVTQTISQACSYTPDFDIYFTEKALSLFCWELGSTGKWEKQWLVAQKVGGLYKACVEVKPDHSKNSTTPKSVQTMKWLYQRHGVYVNLFRPDMTFEGLFTPDKYRLTAIGTIKNLKFAAVTLVQFLTKKGKNGTHVGGNPSPKRPNKRKHSHVQSL